MFGTQQTHDNTSYDYVVEVQSRYTDYLLHKPYVVGVSVGTLDVDNDGDADVIYYCLVVLVSVLVPSETLLPQDRIPDELDGIPVKVQEIGEISAQSAAFNAGG